jgi:hypothetical protein
MLLGTLILSTEFCCLYFRDGVGESQFNQVLDKELGQIIKVNINNMRFLLG